MSMTVVAVRRQTGMELNHRSFSTRQINVFSTGEAGHVEDAERDRAREDRRFASSTAGLTPAIFAEEMMRRSCNVTTAVIEEVEPGHPSVTVGAAQYAEGQSSDAPRSTAAQGPVSFSVSALFPGRVHRS